MTTQEFLRLRKFWYAKRNAPKWNGLSKRHTKGKAAGYGLITVHSFVKPQVPIEKVFPKYF